MAPSIFSACFRCPKAVNSKYKVQKLRLLRFSTAKLLDSIAYSDSTGLLVKFDLQQIAQIQDFSLGGSLMAKKECVQGNKDFYSLIDSVALITNDSVSSVYPVGSSITHIGKIQSVTSKPYYGHIPLPTLNADTSFWKLIGPNHLLFFTVDKMLSVKRMPALLKMYFKDKSYVYSNSFIIRFP